QQCPVQVAEPVPGVFDLFGNAVAISGDTMVVGEGRLALGPNANQGGAFVFRRSGSAWNLEAFLTASDGAANEYFGGSVSISGDTAVIGADHDAVAGSLGQGAAYVFVRSGTAWAQQAKLTAGDRAVNDLFGGSVSIDGDTVVAGSLYHKVGANVEQ